MTIRKLKTKIMVCDKTGQHHATVFLTGHNYKMLKVFRYLEGIITKFKNRSMLKGHN